MKKHLLITCTLSVIALAAVTGCEVREAEPYGGTASIMIEKEGASSPTEFKIRLYPSDNTVSYRYAIGADSDYEAFRDGSMPDITKVEGNDEATITFSELEPGKIYTIFAVSADANNLEGNIASVKIPTSEDNLSAGIQYVLDGSAGFNFVMTSDYRGIRYLIGSSEDKTAVINGDADLTEINEINEYTLNAFDLVPDTEYVLYVLPIDRSGVACELIEIPFKTAKEGECPGVELNYTNNIYEGEYTLTPNSKCSKIASFICAAGEYDEIINSTQHWKGNLVAMISSWETLSGAVYVASGGKPLTMPLTTPKLMPSAIIDIYAMLYDNNGEIGGIVYKQAVTPERDPDLPLPTASVVVSDITRSGATYTYTLGDDTFALFYETIDADWFDDFRENDEGYYEYYIHDLLYSNNGYFSYGQKTVVYKEKYGRRSYRYYAAGCPMNANGVDGGWGELVLEEYTTLAQ